MKRIVMECENDIQHTYGQLNTLLNTSEHDNIENIYHRVKLSMDSILRLNAAYASNTEIFAKTMSQFNEQQEKAEQSQEKAASEQE